MKTKAVGVRIPVDLLDRAKAAIPGFNLSRFVHCALEERFGFTCANSIIDEHESSGVGDVEAAVDNLLKFKRVHQKEEGLDKWNTRFYMG